LLVIGRQSTHPAAGALLQDLSLQVLLLLLLLPGQHLQPLAAAHTTKHKLQQ
jgi:hypothetical protein